MNVTEAKPFNFTLKSKKVVKEMKSRLPKFITMFQSQYVSNKTKLLKEIRPMPVKLIIKNIHIWYMDKAQNAKDSKIVRSQSMPEYLYDLTFNKYGIAKLTEKKLKEICLSVEIHKKKLCQIDLFSRFMGLNEIYYSNDDLTFYYKINHVIFERESFK